MTNDPKKLRIVLLVALCLIIGTAVVYIKVQKFDFSGYDDELYVTRNLYVQKGLSLEGIKWAFTTFHSANWHPLTWLSHMLDCELYGLNPVGHHWTNVEFHIANTLLLFIILFKMTGTLWQSAFVAALFALHPLHVESVAWISERKDVLSTFFGLLSIAVYYDYVQKSSTKYYLLAIVLFALGLMAKPMVITLPFVMLLLDFWPLKRFQLQRDFLLNSGRPAESAVKRNYRIILEKTPFFILVAGSCAVTFFAQKSGGAVKSIAALPLKYRIENAVVSYTSYVLKAIWPHKLAIYYPHPGTTLSLWQIFGASLLLVMAGYAAIRVSKKYPYIPVGLFWYLGTLVPVIGLVQVGDQAMADRYTYIPLVGIFIMVSWGIPDLFKRIGDQVSKMCSPRFSLRISCYETQADPTKRRGKQWSESLSDVWNFFNKSRFQKIFLGISAGSILVALSWNTSFQLNFWKNGVTLFEHAISVTNNNYIAENNLGTACGRFDPDKAISHYKAALKIKPGFAMARYNLGTIYEKKGQTDKAISNYLKALIIDPNYFDALNNLGLVFYHKGNCDRAILYFKRALKKNPKKTDARLNLANVLFFQSKPDEAVSQYQKILHTDSENVDAHFNLAYVLSSQHKINEAVHHYHEALRIDPEYSIAHFKLGNILMRQGKMKQAVFHYAKAIEFKPDYVQAYNRIGLILLEQEKFKKAGVFFSKALQIDPGDSDARANLDIVRKRMFK